MTGNRRKVLLIGVLAGLPVLVFAVYWFAPHTAFMNVPVDEAAPRGTTESRSGQFRGLEHDTKGEVSLLRTTEGKHVLRIANLDTSNGPNLHVYLSVAEAQDDWSVYGKQEFLDLGALKGNLGSANYDVPTNADITKFKSAVVWCKRFSVAFGAAPLELDANR